MPLINAPVVAGMQPKKNTLYTEKYRKELFFPIPMPTFELYNANIEICLVGGANVLKKENDTTADNLIFCIFEIMERKKLSIRKTSTGGYERRTANLTLDTGIVTFTLGDKNEEELFNFISGNTGGMSYE